MRTVNAAFRILVIAVLTGLVALTTMAVGPTALSRTAEGGLALAKSVSPQVGLRSGDTVTYTFVVTNTGGVPLSDIGVDELAFTGTGSKPEVACPADTLQPGGSVTCSAEYDVTDADEDACLIDNTAAATGADPDENTVRSPSSSARAVTNCGAGSGSSDPAEPGSSDPAELGSSDLGGLGSLAAGASGWGSTAPGSAVLGVLGTGSLGLGTLGALSALYFLALGTPYQPGPGAPVLPPQPGSVAPGPA